jgi:hypothetical protein
MGCGEQLHPWKFEPWAWRHLCESHEYLKQKEDVTYSLPMQTVDYVDVRTRARELGCRVPTGIALLPGNFATAVSAAELRYHEVVPEVRSAWRRIGLIDTGPHQKLRRNVAVSPVAPGRPVPLAVFFGLGLVATPNSVLHALTAVATVLIARSSAANAREIRFDGVVERPSNNGYVCLEYHGQPRELVALAKPVRVIWASAPSSGLMTTETGAVE